jgi:hemerythrin
VSDFVRWLDDWLLDIPELDREHHELVDRVNQIAHCQCPEGKNRARACSPAAERHGIRLLEELGLHARRHFKHEEAFMRESDYPQFEDHRYEHITLLAEYAELLREVKDSGLQCLDRSTLVSLKGWLIGHVSGADRRFGEYHRALRSGRKGHSLGRFDRYWTRRAGHH